MGPEQQVIIEVVTKDSIWSNVALIVTIVVGSLSILGTVVGFLWRHLRRK